MHHYRSHLPSKALTCADVTATEMLKLLKYLKFTKSMKNIIHLCPITWLFDKFSLHLYYNHKHNQNTQNHV